ncbi:MAG TPA: hypothetical protein PKZ68_09110 [Pseudomonadales bacterium]|nr:hypothetical protein [Pseudomonadales bacterium]HNI38442.1 hypothetical protein [Pseudomonadales bacterium]
MYLSRSIMLMIMAAYVFSPSLFSWMIDPAGVWYRPYLIWMGLVVVAFLLQPRASDGEEEL